MAVELARKIFGELDGLGILVIGAGKMSEQAARHLRSSGASQVWVANRTYERAVELLRRKVKTGWTRKKDRPTKSQTSNQTGDLF